MGGLGGGVVGVGEGNIRRNLLVHVLFLPIVFCIPPCRTFALIKLHLFSISSKIL